MGFWDLNRHRQSTVCDRTIQRLPRFAWVVCAVIAFPFVALPVAARSLTEQLHAPPEDSRRVERDVADQFLLLGQEQMSLGDYAAALTALQEAANAYHYLGDFVGMGEAFEQLVKVHSTLGQFDHAERVLRQQLSIARSNQNFSDQILALNNLGSIRLQSGDLATAQAAFLEGLELSEDIDSESGIGLSMSNLGLIAAAQGNINDARKYYEVAAGYRARARDYAGQANTDSNLGDVYLAGGQIIEAIGAYRLSLSLARQVDDPYLQLRALDGLIAIYRDRNEPTELSSYLNDRIALTHRTGDDWQRLLTLQTLGEIHEQQGDLRLAHESFSLALSLAQSMDRKQVQAELTNRLLWLSSQIN
ncbi:MAG: tetratricopeptide repeat protein [Cyanobacteria bacterium J06621_11]